MRLSSDGQNWWAKRRGRQVLKGVADGTGLYWVTMTRLAPSKRFAKSQDVSSESNTSKDVHMGSIALQDGNNDGGLKCNPSVSPAPNGRSPTTCNNLTLLPHLSRIADDTDSQSQKSEVSSEDERDVGQIQAEGKHRNRSDIACLTRQQANDLLAAHLRWGHRSFRRCAYILGVPSPVKAPFCEACVEAKASRHRC